VVPRSNKSAKIIGRVIGETRRKAGLTQEQLSAGIGMDRSYVSDVERGAATVSLDCFIQICRGLGVPADKLMRQVDVQLSSSKPIK
jgi:transcriptional regulator with XRE-family HTH domain